MSALECLRHFHRRSGGRLLLLSSDKGYDRAADLIAQQGLGVDLHGGFSLSVNYHAIARYAVDQGGKVLRMPHGHTHLDTIGVILGVPPDGAQETSEAFESMAEDGSPDDYFNVRTAISRSQESFNAFEILAALRLSGYDSSILTSCAHRLVETLPQASAQVRNDLYFAIRKVWQDHYTIGGVDDLPFCLGILLCEMRCYEEAREMLELSLEWSGPTASAWLNLAVCRLNMGQREIAIEDVKRALAADPGMEAARHLLMQLENDHEVSNSIRVHAGETEAKPKNTGEEP